MITSYSSGSDLYSLYGQNAQDVDGLLDDIHVAMGYASCSFTMQYAYECLSVDECKIGPKDCQG